MFTGQWYETVKREKFGFIGLILLTEGERSPTGVGQAGQPITFGVSGLVITKTKLAFAIFP